MYISLSPSLESAIEHLLSKVSAKELKSRSLKLSQDYRKGHFQLATYEDKLAYLAVRLPATFAAITSALSQITTSLTSFCDLGSGPGTALFAARSLYPDIQLHSIEKDPQWIAIAQKLSHSHTQANLQKTAIPQADLILFSYSLGEISDWQETLSRAFDSANPYLAIVEPGTKAHYQKLLLYRDHLIKCGAHLIAPCPHHLKCPMPHNDWCHFSARLPRTNLHRYLKEASLPFEDEKFCYLIASKQKPTTTYDRILRPPIKSKGHVNLTLCSRLGEYKKTIVSKRDKEAYKLAKKSEWNGIIC